MNIDWFSLSRIGLVYDIFGAIVLVSSHLRIGKKEIKEAELFWRDKINIRSIVFEKIDSIFGIALIILGFAGQLVGSDKTISRCFSSYGNVGPLICISVLIVLFVLYYVFRNKLGKIYYKVKTGKEMEL